VPRNPACRSQLVQRRPAQRCHVSQTFDPKAQNDKGVCTSSDLSEGTVTKEPELVLNEDDVLEAKEAPDFPEGTEKQPELVLREKMF
jgi:hypothetical protein